MIAIYKRELSSLLKNVIGWVFLGICSSVYGAFYVVYQLGYGVSNISQTLSFLPYIFMILVPILSMRIFSREKRDKSDRLIYTAPVSIKSVVLGKYLALSTIVFIQSIYFLLTVCLMNVFGDVNYLINFNSLLGFILFSLAAVAIYMFASSLVESQGICALLSFGTLFLALNLPGYMRNIFKEDSVGYRIIGTIELNKPLNDFVSGIFSISSLVYYPVVILLFLFLTGQVIYKKRFNVSREKLSLSAFTIGGVVVAIALSLGINFALSYLPTDTVVDVSSMGIYSITDSTKEYLKKLNDDITIQVYSKKSDTDLVLTRMLDRFKDSNGKITVKYVDPSINPNLGAKIGVEKLTAGSVIVSGNGKNKVISSYELYETSVDYTTYTQSITGFDGEGRIVGAIEYLFSEDTPIIYSLTGHNEVRISERLSKEMDKLNLEHRELNLLETREVPKDCRGIIINAPESDISSDDLDLIKEYISNGGKVSIMVDFVSINNQENLRELMGFAGLNPVEGVICEDDEKRFYNYKFYLFPTVAESDVTTGITGDLQIFTPYSLGFKADELGENVKAFLLTSEGSYAKASLSNEEDIFDTGIVENIAKEDSDISGPFAVAAFSDVGSDGRVYAFGSPFMFSDGADEVVVGRNTTLFINLIKDMVGEAEEINTSVSIKRYESPTLTVSQSMVGIYGFILVILIPLATIFAGLTVWIIRRKK